MKPRNFILIALMQAACVFPAYSQGAGFTIGSVTLGGTQAPILPSPVVTQGPALTTPPVITTGSLTTLASFGGTKGVRLTGGLLQGTDSNFYGTTVGGGTTGFGTVFKITMSGSLTIFNSFTNTNGYASNAGMVPDGVGNFYGTTTYGGKGSGVIFKRTPAGVVSALRILSGTSGTNPYSPLTMGSDGFFYGTATSGGQYGYGTVFKIATNGSFSTLHSFTKKDGASPYAGLVQGSDGSFYGTTVSGGTNGGYGTVFNITTSGTLTTLYSFHKTDGSAPYGGLVQGIDGNFYGSTQAGGPGGFGTLFKIDSTGNLTTLNFFNGKNGSAPYGTLIQATDGNFYGTTYSGGANGFGTVFQLSMVDGLVYSLFSFSGANGTYPYSGLIEGSDGNLYGTTEYGGSSNLGTVFQLALTSGVTANTATFLGSVNPKGTDTTVYFQYDTSTAYGNATTPVDIGSGTKAVPVTTTVGGLQLSTLYYYQLVVSSSLGTFYGPNLTFTTAANDFEWSVMQYAPAVGIKGAQFSTSGNLAMNDNLGVAFMATVSGTSAAATTAIGTNTTGIWADVVDTSNTTSVSLIRQLVVRVGASAPGTPGDQFSVLSDPVYNNNNAIAFKGTLKSGVGDVVATPVNNSIGIWANTSGTLALVARQGKPAAGCTDGALFSSFTQFVLPDAGGVILLANLTGGYASASNNLGIWAVDMTGALTLVARTGDPLNGKTIKSLSFLSQPALSAGQTRSYSQASGNILYKATFTDNSWGIFGVQLSSLP